MGGPLFLFCRGRASSRWPGGSERAGSGPRCCFASGGPIFSHLNALRAAVWREAYGLAAQKWGKNRWGESPRPPFFAQSVCIGEDTEQPLKFCQAAGPS